MHLNGNAGATQIIAYVVSGVGFLGAGVIMKQGSNVWGLYTAATLWCSAAVGACAGADMAFEAVALTCFVLAGNTLLELFLRIIVEFFRRHWTSTEQELPSWGDVVAVEHAHLRILEAIGAGDDSLARYRARRHLDAAAASWL